MYITVMDFLSLFVETLDTIEIYDMNEQETVFEGWMEDIPERLQDLEVASVDWPSDGKICINVEV